ncbi:MAG TPA: hypothetical protein VNW51_05935, partial [Mucilaginibacter sp.]|nr:hypothetical protein [Mucilaginibacter sp.]
FSKAYGSYPFANVSLAETSVVGPKETGLCTLDTYSEQFAWNANFTGPEQKDYCYLNTVRHLGAQWWRYGMATDQKAGSANMIEGLCNYGMLVMAAQKYGAKNMRSIIQEQLTYYLLVRRHLESPEQPLLISDAPYVRGKAAAVLYGLRGLMGADSLNAALREFRSAYVSKSDTVLAGSSDLFRYLRRHVPDSLLYYLTDSWQKVTLYDNKINQVQVKPAGRNSYQITVDLTVGKTWTDSQGHDHPVTAMKDYIDIGVFGPDRAYANGRKTPNPLYLKRYKLGYGRHTLRFTVRGKPRTVEVDPYSILIDRQPNDNIKVLE